MRHAVWIACIISLVVGLLAGYYWSYSSTNDLVAQLEGELLSLQLNYTSLSDEYKDLLGNYNALSYELYELTKAYENLALRYEALLSNESGVALSVFVSSSLNAVEVNVTNTYNSSLSVVVLFVTFTSEEPLQVAYDVCHLEPGESRMLSFELTSEVEKFKVLAVTERGAREAEVEAGETTLLVDEEYYESLIQDLRGAKDRILVAMYSMIYDPGDSFDYANDVIEELARAAKRGVEVYVFLEHKTYYGEMERNLEAYEYLLEHGVHVKLDEQADTDHMKLVIIDGEVVYVGSHNWSESALYYNHETTLRCTEESIVEAAEDYFWSLWSEG